MNKKASIRKKLYRLKVDGILITDLLNVKYLTGFTGSSGYVLISQSDALFITDFRYQEQAKQEVKGYKIKIERGERSKEIKGLTEQYGIKKLGFEDHNAVYGFYISSGAGVQVASEQAEMATAAASGARSWARIRSAAISRI